MTAHRKKLIEVSLPLEAINAASAREKSIRHGHPSTIHLWWARRPLAACRAVLFAQLVDDPSAWPGRFPFPEIAKDEDSERRRLHKIIERMVPWEASNDEAILNDARWEIARSVAWGLGEKPPPRGNSRAILDYLQAKAPPVYDPFSGGGSIPLEAQRLGLRAYGSDLNPVAVLIGKALVEIPPKFGGRPPVNAEAQAELKRGGQWNSKGAQGLAEDVRYYGRWMREEAEKRIGHLYPRAQLPDGSEAKVIAWLWARTVASPDPVAKAAMVPLVSSFMLSTKEGRKAWVEPVIDPGCRDGWRFDVRTGALSRTDEEKISRGTKTGRGTNFECLLTGTPITPDYVRKEGVARRLGSRLLAIVAEGDRGRVYLPPTADHEVVATSVKPRDIPTLDVDMPDNPRWFSPPGYGMRTFASLFTARQLAALTTFSELVGEAREKVLGDAHAVSFSEDIRPLSQGGAGPCAYADAVATYLGLALSKLSAAQSAIGVWKPSMEQSIAAFGRQAIAMTWDFPESNVFGGMAGDLLTTINNMMRVVEGLTRGGGGEIFNIDASENSFPIRPVSFSSDPPYYDNIGYADLSDFFYVWQKLSLEKIWPNLFRRLTTPKAEELVATPYRHGGRGEAERFFMSGMRRALEAVRSAAVENTPSSIYYAFKQSEIGEEGVTSAGWSSFLQAVVDSGFAVDGTWPIRTELVTGLKGNDNYLASSIVLVCRKRLIEAPAITRADFVRALKRELPDAIEAIRRAGVGPVDMQQSVIGPGMGIFSRHSKVLEDDDGAMTVKTALALINRVWEEIENELDAAFDPETQVALAWYASYGFEARSSGELITLATAKNTSDRSLFHSGVFEDRKGRAALRARETLSTEWTPAKDTHLTVWECVQNVAARLTAEDGGTEAAARLVAQMASKSADVRKLAYRLFEIATQKGWAAEALVYNELAEVWPKLEDVASAIDSEALSLPPAQRGLFEEA